MSTLPAMGHVPDQSRIVWGRINDRRGEDARSIIDAIAAKLDLATDGIALGTGQSQSAVSVRLVDTLAAKRPYYVGLLSTQNDVALVEERFAVEAARMRAIAVLTLLDRPLLFADLDEWQLSLVERGAIRLMEAWEGITKARQRAEYAMASVPVSGNRIRP